MTLSDRHTCIQRVLRGAHPLLIYPEPSMQQSLSRHRALTFIPYSYTRTHNQHISSVAQDLFLDPHSQADSDRILLDCGVSIPVVDESFLVLEACKGCNAAILVCSKFSVFPRPSANIYFKRDEESLVLWSHSVSSIAQEYRELSHRLQHYVGECFCASISQRMVLNSIPSISVFSHCDFEFDFTFLSNTENDFTPLSSDSYIGHDHSPSKTNPKLTNIYLDSPSSTSPQELPVNKFVFGVRPTRVLIFI